MFIPFPMQQILFSSTRSFYDANPWPKKSDLVGLANRCGLKRRVVQVSLSERTNYLLGENETSFEENRPLSR